MKQVLEGARGSQNFRPVPSASKTARSAAGWKALWWWSNHQSSRGEGEKRKSTTALTSPSKASGGKGSPCWCCSGTKAVSAAGTPCLASMKRLK
jgi:hypothetical protein